MKLKMRIITAAVVLGVLLAGCIAQRETVETTEQPPEQTTEQPPEQTTEQPPEQTTVTPEEGETYLVLPAPEFKGDMSVEEAIRMRRSIRDFKNTPLSLEQVSQLLWAGQGITKGVKRAAPSAGSTYPLTLYLAVGEGGVKGLTHGLYKYIPEQHALVLVKEGDLRERIAAASWNQTFIQKAPVNIVIVAEYERTTGWYGERGIRYVHMEAGHVGENIYLQAVALHLGTVVVGAFEDEDLKKVLDLPEEQNPLYVMPVGYPA